MGPVDVQGVSSNHLIMRALDQPDGYMYFIVLSFLLYAHLYKHNAKALVPAS